MVVGSLDPLVGVKPFVSWIEKDRLKRTVLMPPESLSWTYRAWCS